jgi:ABC-2 type transport system ATP-binding protein
MDHGKILVNDTPAQLKRMMPGGMSLEVRARAPPSENGLASARVAEALEATPGVAKVESLQDDGKDAEPGSLTYRVYSESANTLIGPAAQAVFAAGAQVRDLSVKQPSLEEVFIFLTGRHLR